MGSNRLSRILQLVRKEFLAILGDRVSRAVLIVPPIIQLIVFSFAASQDVVNVKLGVLNFDSGRESASFIRAFQTEPVFKEIIPLDGYAHLNDAIDRQTIHGAIVIPEDFSCKILSGDQIPEFSVTLDGRRANASAILGGYIARIAQTYGVKTDPNVATTSRMNDPVLTRYWFNPNLIARNAFIPGLVCIVMTTIGMLVSATSIARERELGTFEQLLVSPLTPFEIVLGKALAAVCIATFSATLILIVIVYGFRMPLLGPLWLYYATTILYLTSIVNVGLFISSLSTTQQQATLGIFLFMPPAVMTSGYATPVDNMPLFLQYATIVNPVRWEIVVLKGLFLRGSSLESVVLCLTPLGCVAAVTFALAIYMFKRRIE